jgi:expansin (peptidoglycan-binding protein)
MIKLQYFNGKEWVDVSEWHNEAMAWISLGDDNFNYRTVDVNGNVLTDKSKERE